MATILLACLLEETPQQDREVAVTLYYATQRGVRLSVCAASGCFESVLASTMAHSSVVVIYNKRSDKQQKYVCKNVSQE